MNIQDAMTYASTKAWGFSPDSAIFGTSENLTMLAEFNSSILHNTAKEDFPFQNSSITFNTIAGQRNYPLSVGVVEKAYLTGANDYLELIAENPFLDSTIGTPTQFYLKYFYNQLYIYLHKIPDSTYTVNIDYQVNDFVLAEDGTTKQKFTLATDILNLPTHLQDLFWECIILRAMQTNLKDATDENYAPIISEYKEAWVSFILKSNPLKQDKRIIF